MKYTITFNQCECIFFDRSHAILIKRNEKCNCGCNESRMFFIEEIKAGNIYDFRTLKYQAPNFPQYDFEKNLSLHLQEYRNILNQINKLKSLL